MGKKYYKTPLHPRPNGQSGSLGKVSDSWDDCDAMPHYTYSKGWWAETKRLVDESYARLVAKGFFDDTSDYWAKREKAESNSK